MLERLPDVWGCKLNSGEYRKEKNEEKVHKAGNLADAAGVIGCRPVYHFDGFLL